MKKGGERREGEREVEERGKGREKKEKEGTKRKERANGRRKEGRKRRMGRMEGNGEGMGANNLQRRRLPEALECLPLVSLD